MFGNRTDGRKIKNLDAFFRLMPHLMKKRSDAQNFFQDDIPISKLDEYINKKAEEGINLSYMHIVYTALVRILAEKPALNRFVMNGRTYARHGIHISLVIKKGMAVETEETSVKMKFTGAENIFEVKEKLDKEINTNKDVETKNNTDKLAKVLSRTPNFILKFTINMFRFLDRYGYLPKAVIHASPFHTSAFLTNIGSLGIGAIYHHLYDFGTTGIFVAMGKKQKSYVYDDDVLVEEKTIPFALVADERFCDGFYYASAIKLFKKYMKKPELLEENIIPIEDIK